MVNKLIGKKLGMTRIFLDEGKSIPVTVLKVGPCVVLQKKTREKDGYDAIQVGYESRKETRVNKPLKGHFEAAAKGCFAHLKEIRVEDTEEFELGHEIKSDVFQAGDRIQISGLSKGRGFSGCSASPGRVTKGKKLPGRMGHQRVTIKNLRVVDVRPEMDVILVKGSVPGSSNSLIEISKV
jgi:large subunit ribosomal protein L3